MAQPITLGSGHTPKLPENPQVGRMGSRVCVRQCAALGVIAVPLVTLVALANLPTAEAAGGPGTVLLPACLAACVAATTAASATGPWTAFAVWTSCKAACIAAAVAF